MLNQKARGVMVPDVFHFGGGGFGAGGFWGMALLTIRLPFAQRYQVPFAGVPRWQRAAVAVAAHPIATGKQLAGALLGFEARWPANIKTVPHIQPLFEQPTGHLWWLGRRVPHVEVLAPVAHGVAVRVRFLDDK